MQENLLYEYAVIRLVPRVERGEYLNAGVILLCRKAGFIKMLYKIDEAKLKALCPEADTEQLTANLESFSRISAGSENGGPIAQMDIASRFRWLTAMRSSVIQTSRPHPGLCTNPEGTVQRLFEDMVL